MLKNSLIQCFARILLTSLMLAEMSCTSAPPRADTNLFPKANAVNRLVEDHFEETLKLEPLFATSIGDHRFDDQLTVPLSEAHRAQTLALVEKSLKAIQALACDHLDEQTLLTCEAFTDDLSAEKNLLLSDLSHLMPINQFDSFFADFPDLAAGTSYVTFDHKIDYENFLSRMHQVPTYFDAIIANSNLGIKQGITTPRVLVEKALKQLDAILAPRMSESLFYKPLLTLDQKVPALEQGDLKARYTASIEKEILPAYHKLREYIKTTYLPKARQTHGLSALPGGSAFYAALVKSNTTTDQNPNQIMVLGLSEVKRIRAEFEETKKALKFSGSLRQFFNSLRKDPKLYPFHSEKGVLDGYESIHARLMKAIPSQFNLLPKAPFEIREVDKFKAENASEAYQNASPDGTRPGIFWVPVPDPRKYSSKDMESLFLHEAIPGHHFQISIQQELPGLPRYRRFSGNNAYVEGWALYTEGLGKELGLYTDPYQWVGRLSNEMHRAVRLVVDTGIHAKGWTREKAIAYAMDNEAYEEASIVSETERYMAIPGQALSYKMGELKILELKRKTAARMGKTFDPRIFHDQILKDGALPLSTLERKFDRWLK